MEPTEEPVEYDRTKIRIGLAIIGVVFLVAVVALFVVTAPAGKALMFAIAAVAMMRLFLLARSLRS